MGGATVPMALLNFGAFAAGVWLLVGGNMAVVATGMLFGIALLGAGPALPEEDSRLADFGHRALVVGRKGLAYCAAIFNSVIPLFAILASEIVVLMLYRREPDAGLVLWLWSYGVATGAWSLRARRARAEHRTVRGIQAWAAQLSYMLLSLALLVWHWSLGAALLLVAFPMLLPLVAGTMVALADRNELRDVQI